MKNAELLLNIGNNMYNKAKYFIYFAPVGFLCILIASALCGEYASEYLMLCGHYFLVNFLFFGFYIYFGIGLCAVFPYYMGLILIGIGQIAANTSPDITDNTITDTNVSADAKLNTDTNIKKTTGVCNAEDAAVLKDIRIGDGNWRCTNCQTVNSNNYGQCKKCGKFKGVRV